MDRVTRVRIFAAGEFAAPADWPDGVGVAAILSEGIEVFPAHARESGAEVLRRISSLSGADLRDAPVHPPVEGHPPCDLSFSAVADLRVAVEDFLSRYPQALEEAEDFAVNFGYAVDEGIAFPALVAPTPLPPATGSDNPAAPRTDPAPVGYLPLEEGQPHLRFSRPVLRVSVDGGLMVLLDPDLPAVASASPPVLLREDGMGLAIPANALSSADGSIRALRLPPGCLPWIPEGVEGEIPLVAVERGGFLLLSFLPEWAWAAPRMAEEPAEAAADETPRGWVDALRSITADLWQTRIIGFAALSAIAIGLGLGLAGRGDAQGGPVPVSPAVEALRAGLFD